MRQRPKDEYPYYPEGGHEIYVVSVEDEFIQAAREAQEELAGDQIYPVGVVYVRDGKVIARGGNGFNLGSEHVHVCPRIVHECKSGEGYDLCGHHDSPGHAERMAIKNAKENDVDLTGADCYLYGHHWACQPCWDAMAAEGVQNLYLPDNAHEYFSRAVVHDRTLGTPNVKKIYLSGGLTNAPADVRDLYNALKMTANEVGVEMYCPHEHSDPQVGEDGLSPSEVYELDRARLAENEVVIAYVGEPSLGTGMELAWAEEMGKPVVLLSEKGKRVSRAALGLPAVVYHHEFTSHEDAARALKNILKQL